jgi:serine/threonine protein kinase
MSPEQVRGRPLDARSDLYSLGILVFELFTGRLPFDFEGAQGAMIKHLEEEPALDDWLLPRELEPVLRRVLSKDPEERQPDVAELARQIAAAQGAGPAAAPEDREGGAPAAAPEPRRYGTLSPEEGSN